MTPGEDGWWTPAEPLPAAADAPDVDYGYLLDDDDHARPDPRSRRQPHGVHGKSRRFDPSAHAWQDSAWTGRQLAGAVIYELHVGTFTPEGTLDAAIGRLDHLRSIGVDLVELMPVNAVQRHPQLGLRRRALVRRARAVRRPGGVPALRRRLPRGRARRRPGRGLQPPRPVGELPAAVRPVPQVGLQHLGRPGQPRRRGLRGGAPLRPRQRAHVAARLPRRRPAARRRPRARPTPRRCTCWSSWRSRSPRSRRTSGGR